MCVYLHTYSERGERAENSVTSKMRAGLLVRAAVVAEGAEATALRESPESRRSLLRRPKRRLLPVLRGRRPGGRKRRKRPSRKLWISISKRKLLLLLLKPSRLASPRSLT